MSNLKKNILLVEDDNVILSMYQKLLTNHGFDVKVASDGEAGLKLALELHPDMILLDVRMPKMDGMTMLKLLRNDDWGKKAKVIILTNLDATDELLKGVIENQPTYYLIKSNNSPDQVLEKITEVLDNSN